jgi:RHS repeat-associated protein
LVEGVPTTTTSSTTYCYDAADRLLGSVVSGTPMPEANPVADGLTASELTYDAHGNTTRLADQSLTFDLSNRHLSTTIDHGDDTETVIEYVRDVTNRIVARTVNAPGETQQTVRYAHTATTDLSGMVVDAQGSVQEYTVSLPGGAAVRFVLGSNAREQWTYPNLQGSIILEADGDGIRASTVVRYDPWGQPIDPETGRIGTTTADDSVIDNAPGDADYAFVGAHRKLYEHQGSVAVVQMGARVFVPALGRFLSVDPVEGGVDNAYVYPTDPVNKLDLTGMIQMGMMIDGVAKTAKSIKAQSVATKKVHPLNGVVPVVVVRQAPKCRPDGTNCPALAVSVSTCGGVCVQHTYLQREDDAKYAQFGLGLGPEASAEVGVGTAWGASTGLSTTLGCSAAYIWGYQISASTIVVDWGTFPPETTIGGQSGFTGGLGAGCSGFVNYTTQLPF